MHRVPARYIGSYPVTLANGSYTNAEGRPLASNLLNPGDTVCLPEHEVLGYTHKYEARRIGNPENLGTGRVILPEDRDVSEDELFARGYEFVLGRSDFEPVTPVSRPPTPSSKKRESAPSKE